MGIEDGEPWEWRSRAVAAEITLQQLQRGDSAADEIKQAHDDLDILQVPRTETGLPLSVPGRILLFARRLHSSDIRQSETK